MLETPPPGSGDTAGLCWNRSAWTEIVSNGYSFLIEMLYPVPATGWRIGEGCRSSFLQNRQRGRPRSRKLKILKPCRRVAVGLERVNGRASSSSTVLRKKGHDGASRQRVRSGLTTRQLLSRSCSLFDFLCLMAVRQPADITDPGGTSRADNYVGRGQLLRADPFSHTLGPALARPRLAWWCSSCSGRSTEHSAWVDWPCCGGL